MAKVISSGHSLKVRGAKGVIDEVDEARKVVDKVAEYMKQLGETVHIFHDNTSTTKDKNLATIVAYHNGKVRDLDISIHFNAASYTADPRGTEVFYYAGSAEGKAIATKVSKAIADAGGFKNRGAKDNGLYFTAKTAKVAILIEVCFVDSEADAKLYKANFDKICRAIAESIIGKSLPTVAVAQTNKVYRLMTGTFATKEGAEAGLAKMKATGAIGVGYVQEDVDYFRVLTGTFSTYERAKSAYDTIKNATGYTLYIKEYEV